MDEAQWLEYGDVRVLLLHFVGMPEVEHVFRDPVHDALLAKISQRRARLFGVGCCRLIWHLLTKPWLRRTVEQSERYADGVGTEENLIKARERVYKFWAELPEEHPLKNPAGAAMSVAEAIASWVATLTFEETGYARWRKRGALKGDLDFREEAVVFRDLIGNPFRPVVFNSAWRNPVVLALAQAAYDERTLPAGTLDPERLAVLADALEDAGCDNTQILKHLRSPGPHMRGCWPVDLLLDKS
jgi:hypothetical protein